MAATGRKDMRVNKEVGSTSAATSSLSGALSSDASNEIEKTTRFIFRGSFEHLLDDKGRVSFPATFRQTLLDAKVNSIVVTNAICDGVRCLDGYALPDWERFEEKLRSRSRFDSQLRKLENFYLSRAVECSLDASGRINIPPTLRTYAGFEKEVVYAAASHGFRLWDKRVWDHVFTEAESALIENPDLFVDVDL